MRPWQAHLILGGVGTGLGFSLRPVPARYPPYPPPTHPALTCSTHPELPFGPSPFFPSSLPALGPLPMGPENLTPGAMWQPYGGESTNSSPAMLAIHWETWPQNITQKSLNLFVG